MRKLTNHRFHVTRVRGGYNVLATWHEGEDPLNSQPQTVATLDEAASLMHLFFDPPKLSGAKMAERTDEEIRADMVRLRPPGTGAAPLLSAKGPRP